MKITLDTNILISAAIYRGNEFRILKLVQSGIVQLVLSLNILSEFRNVMSRPKFRFSKKMIDDEILLLLKLSEFVFPVDTLNVVKDDQNDNMVLECALAGKVDYIITGDSHLLNLKSFKGIKIVRSSDFLKLV